MLSIDRKTPFAGEGTFRAAARIVPVDPELHYIIYLFWARPVHRSLREYCIALTLKPDYADAHYNLEVFLRAVAERGKPLMTEDEYRYGQHDYGRGGTTESAVHFRYLLYSAS